MPHSTRLLALALTLALVLTGCPSGTDPRSALPSPSVSTPPGCPVTLPGSAGTPPVDRGDLYGWESSFGNAGLWVGGLGQGGIIEPMRQDDGTLGHKLGWYRLTEGVLVITGRRLDGPAEALRSDVPNGYASGFQSSGVYFPVPGCWEITGTVGSATLTFVTYVRV